MDYPLKIISKVGHNSNVDSYDQFNQVLLAFIINL